MSIKLLSPSLQNQIAAGEVVERPASIVKELVENSIDAGADDIRIEIEEGGVKKIRIIDNGKGMNEDDARKCFTRYATSKIEKVDDLFTLSSFGFRGEALASIASVSHMTLKTKQKQENQNSENIGLEIVYKANVKPEDLEVFPCSIKNGTEILIENVFWNVPARKKFLKSERTEEREIVKIVENFAMSNPHVSFLLKVNGIEKLSCMKNSLENRAHDILGNDITQHFLPLYYEGLDIKISGFTTHYNYQRSNRSKQYIFVNNRIISSDSVVYSAVSQAYETLLARGKFSAFVLHIHITPDEVDVNVHPRKTEVKFLNSANVFKAVKQAFVSSLENKSITSNTSDVFVPILSEKQQHIAQRFSVPNISFCSSSCSSSHSSSSFPRIPVMQPSFMEQSEFSETEESSWKIIGQVRKSFIVIEEKNGLRIVDQHAAHERVRLEALIENMNAKKVVSQPLLASCVFSLSQSDKDVLLEQKEYLQNIGFEIIDFGKTEIAITAVPAGSEHIDIEKLFIEALENCDFFVPEFSSIQDSFSKRLLSYAACRGAKMFGDFMSEEEMKALITDWKKCKNPDSCAHGRPVSIFHRFDEMEKKCGRC